MGVVSCGPKLVHTPIALNILAGMIILASFHPLRRQKRTVTVANLRNLPVAFLDADRSRRLAARQRYQLAVT